MQLFSPLYIAVEYSSVPHSSADGCYCQRGQKQDGKGAWWQRERMYELRLCYNSQARSKDIATMAMTGTDSVTSFVNKHRDKFSDSRRQADRTGVSELKSALTIAGGACIVSQSTSAPEAMSKRYSAEHHNKLNILHYARRGTSLLGVETSMFADS